LENEHSRTFIRCALAQFIAIHGWKNRVIGAPAQLAYNLLRITAATAANTGRPKGTLKADNLQHLPERHPHAVFVVIGDDPISGVADVPQLRVKCRFIARLREPWRGPVARDSATPAGGEPD